MRSKYNEDLILKALNEIANDKEAADKLRDDICKVIAAHIDAWLERSERYENRVDGIIIEKDGHSRLLCPKCKSLYPITVTYCNHCGVQLQDSWLEKIRKKNLMGME